MVFRIIISLCAGLFIFASVPALAGEKEWSITNKGEIEFDDDNKWKNSVELTYGLTDRMEITIAGDTLKTAGESLDYKASKIELTYKLTDDEYWLESKIEAECKVNHLGSADKVKAKIKLKKSFGQWDYKIEPYLEHEIGEKKESGLGAGLELETYYNFDSYSLGGVYEVDFGRLKDHNNYEEQDHYIGSLISFDLPVAGYDVGVELGYLVGLSRASTDHIFKYEFEYQF